MDVMSRDNTLEFLGEHVKTDMLMKHLLSVEASMRGYARKFGEDEEAGPSPGCCTTSTGRFVPRPRATRLSAPGYCERRAIRRT